MKDERIQTTVNRIGTRVCLIWYVLMLISLYYRLLILKQHPRDFWDIFAIFLIGSLYGFIALANKGGLDYEFKRRWLIICIAALIGILAMQFITGQVHSVVEVGACLIASLPGMGLVIGIAYLLNRRWKRKEGIDDEQ